MIRLVDLKTVDQFLYELKEYAQEVDVPFVKKAVSAIGRCAIKLERAADRCVQSLLDLIRTRVEYLVQESVKVIKDIFRKYPNRYESIIKDLCDNLRALDSSDAKAAMIWIIGQYGERIDNTVDLISNFAENFTDESEEVQMSILTAAVKIYLKLEGEAEEMIMGILKMATEESDNPDLRNRGYIYWRMLSADPEGAKKVILAPVPPISEDVSNFDAPMLEKLIQNIGTLSSIYSKPPEQFVKKIRDRVNERFDLEDHEEEEAPADYEDSTGQKRSEIKVVEAQIESFNLLEFDDPSTPTEAPSTSVGGSSATSSVTGGLDELMSIGATAPVGTTAPVVDPLADLMGG